MRLAAHDQLALVALAARPARKTGGDDFLGQLVEFGLALLEPALDFDLTSASVRPRMRALRKFDASIIAEVGSQPEY